MGYHTNFALAITPKAIAMTIFGAVLPSAVVEPQLADRIYPLSQNFFWLLREFGYFHMQSTKPDTLGMFTTALFIDDLHFIHFFMKLFILCNACHLVSHAIENNV